MVLEANAEAAQLVALAMAVESYPPAQGYTGHGAFVEVAPLAWLKLVLPFARNVEPYVPTREIDHARPDAPPEEVTEAVM
jgi:hypothetical protein